MREADQQLQQQLSLLQMEKKDHEAALQAELGQLRATLHEKDTSYTADKERLETVHLEEMKLKDATPEGEGGCPDPKAGALG